MRFYDYIEGFTENKTSAAASKNEKFTQNITRCQDVVSLASNGFWWRSYLEW